MDCSLPSSPTETCELVTFLQELSITFLTHSWRRSRRAAHEGLSKSAVRSYHMILRKEGVLLASALLENPRALEKLFQRTAASAIMSIVYDYPTLEIENDKNVKDIRVFNERMSKAGAPGAYLVELFPWMVYIPEMYVLVSSQCSSFPHLTGWPIQDSQNGSMKESDTSFNIPACLSHFSMIFILRLWVWNPRFSIRACPLTVPQSKGSERPSICASLITDSDRNGLSNREMAWLAGTLLSVPAFLPCLLREFPLRLACWQLCWRGYNLYNDVLVGTRHDCAPGSTEACTS